MIRAEFFVRKGLLAGFCISGHAGISEAGTDILCAAVSSAAYMTANTITDVIGAKANVSAEDGKMYLMLSAKDAAACGVLLKGFRMHLLSLKEQYPENITLTDTEV
jgi:uncharacterized protein YsxB (DUF464 family)